MDKKSTLEFFFNNNSFNALAHEVSASLRCPIVITDNAFSGCESLVTISLVKANKIGKNAFYGCVNLTSITASSGEWKTTESSDFTNGVITDFSIKNLTTTYANNYWYI